MNELKKLLCEKTEIQKTDKETPDYGIVRKLFDEKLKSLDNLTLKIKFLRKIKKEINSKLKKINKQLDYIELECLGTSEAYNDPEFNSLNSVCEWLTDIQQYIKIVLITHEKDYYKKLSLLLINRLLKKDDPMEVDILF